MLGLGLSNPVHIAFIVLIVLLVFGAKRLPEIGSSLGAGLRGFKESVTGESSSTTQDRTAAAAPPASLTAASAPVPAAPAPRAPEHADGRPAA